MAAKIVAIAIVADNGVIGDGKKQPFEFKEDWARFKQVTLGHPMVMGRKTQDAIGRFLPGRTTIIVSRNPDAVEIPEDAEALAVGSVGEALHVASLLDEVVFVAGGGEIYRQAWDSLTHLDLTMVHSPAEGPVRFPDIDPDEWVEVRREPHGEFDFVGFERRPRG